MLKRIVFILTIVLFQVQLIGEIEGNKKKEILFKRAVSNFEDGNYKELIYYYKELAEQGEKEAMYNLGKIYYHGLGVRKNYKEAKKWYEKASELGDIYSMNNLSKMYYEGLGVKKNEKKCKELLEKAFNSGTEDISIIYNLSAIYYHGIDGEIDTEKAAIYYKKMFGNNSMEKKYQEYKKSQGVIESYDKKNYEIANKLKSTMGNELTLELSYLRPNEWYEILAYQGNSDAMNSLGDFYRIGFYISKDYVKAKKWYKKAAELGNNNAMNNLGNIYKKGNGVKQDYLKAKNWFEKAAGLGNSDAMDNLGIIYYDGLGVEKNCDKAKEWFDKCYKKRGSSSLIYLEYLELNKNKVINEGE